MEWEQNTQHAAGRKKQKVSRAEPAAPQTDSVDAKRLCFVCLALLDDLAALDEAVLGSTLASSLEVLLGDFFEVPALAPEDQRWMEKRLSDRIQQVESSLSGGTVQALAEQVKQVSARLDQLQGSSPGSESPEEEESQDEALARMANVSSEVPGEVAAGSGHLHSLVLHKESKMSSAVKKSIAEVLREHHKSNGGDCRRNKERTCRGFVSQGLQDVFLYTVLWRHLSRPGVYLDLAAHDYRYISNTYFADHCLKFDGVCVEPNSEYHNELITKRRCAVVKTCVAETKKDVTFILQGPFGGIESERKFMKKTAGGGKRTTLTCQTLSDIFRQYQMTHVDFMSLDVEGAELACLQGIDWNAVSIDTILVEQNDNSFANVASLLTSRGYVNATQLHRDVFFVHTSAKGLLEKVEAWNRDVCPRINEALRPGIPRFYACQ
ncbi:unnamed protein product [Symbiodinium natans]|uniref:Methyltransferase FkbM domain-containing protein n=1 Tax=Symbiodinium natans TaxID=878477 RepID=A0A812G2D3_9DINO|nr:unnamed protein product [Symbiodinium natans]